MSACMGQLRLERCIIAPGVGLTLAGATMVLGVNGVAREARDSRIHHPAVAERIRHGEDRAGPVGHDREGERGRNEKVPVEVQQEALVVVAEDAEAPREIRRVLGRVRRPIVSGDAARCHRVDHVCDVLEGLADLLHGSRPVLTLRDHHHDRPVEFVAFAAGRADEALAFDEVVFHAGKGRHNGLQLL
eukprot:3958898-Prymnesium_polylepis.1